MDDLYRIGFTFDSDGDMDHWQSLALAEWLEALEKSVVEVALEEIQAAKSGIMDRAKILEQKHRGQPPRSKGANKMSDQANDGAKDNRVAVGCTALVGCSAECDAYKALANVVKAWKSGGGFALVQACESAEKMMDARSPTGALSNGGRE